MNKPKAYPQFIKLMNAAQKHVDAMVPRADNPSPQGPMWYGWALRSAFIAGANWQKKRKPKRRRATKGAGR